MRIQIICCLAICLAFFAGLLAACGDGSPAPVVAENTPTASDTPPAPTATATPFQPSPTPVPLAARVNGEEITLEEFQAELARFNAAQAAAGTETADGESESRVLADLVDQVLLAQGAFEAGFELDEDALQTRLEQLAGAAGGEQALAAWMAENGYTLQTLRVSLARAMAVAWMRDQIINSVPQVAEQVHARQVILASAEEANQVLAQLNAGTSFATFTAIYAPVTAGDLGWFPRGYLTDAQLEAAVFSLQPGDFSQVIETRHGFHIVQVIEVDALRPLEPDARLALQAQSLEKWLEERRGQSEIVELLPPTD